MDFAFDYSDGVWAVMPPIGGDDESWIAQQRADAEAVDPLRGADADARARDALAARRQGIGTSLYFRPPGLVGSGVLHLTFAEVVADESGFRAEEWIPEGVAEGFAPVVSDFETDHCAHGFRVAYLSQWRLADGDHFAGIVYALRFDDGLGTVFSELGDRETIGLMQLYADPLVASLRLVA